MKTLARLNATGVRLPPRKVCALLVVAFFAFGIAIGRAARSSVETASLASTGAPVRVLVPAVPASAGTEATRASPPPAPAGEAEPAPAAPSSPATAASPNSAAAGAPAAAPAPAPRPKATKSPESATKAPQPATKLPPIRHVFVIMLSDDPYAAVFGPESAAHYLVGQLEPRGALLSSYDAVAHEELANEIALISGQGPTAETAADCPTYSPLVATGAGADEQVLGSGCVYPASTQTLPQELTAKHLSWRAYVEGIDEAGTQSPPCDHPLSGQSDPTAPQNGAVGPYATFRNPFAYFASLTGTGECAREDVGLGHLRGDLAKSTSTANFSYIVPGRCEDGDPTPCAPGASAGIAAADAFLRRVVPQITGSQAFKHDGLLVITVDEAPSSGEFADSSSCCGQPQFPNLPAAQTPLGRPRGGGAVGALLLSPFVKGPTSSQEPYNHFSLLATVEQLFGLRRLGYASLPSVKPLAPSIFTAPAG